MVFKSVRMRGGQDREETACEIQRSEWASRVSERTQNVMLVKDHIKDRSLCRKLGKQNPFGDGEE